LITDEGLKSRIQELMDLTLKGWGPDGEKTTTSDRQLLGKKGFDPRVPTRLIVVQVSQVENPENYLNFRHRKVQLAATLMSGCPWPDAPEVRTKGVQVRPTYPVDDSIHEVYLWHGTNLGEATSICSTDFDLKLGASAGGCLFGRGVYFAESCLKADEHCHPDESGLYPMLLARVVLGRVHLGDLSLKP